MIKLVYVVIGILMGILIYPRLRYCRPRRSVRITDTGHAYTPIPPGEFGFVKIKRWFHSMIVPAQNRSTVSLSIGDVIRILEIHDRFTIVVPANKTVLRG